MKFRIRPLIEVVKSYGKKKIMKNYKEVTETVLEIAEEIGSFPEGVIGDVLTFIDEMEQEGWNCWLNPFFRPNFLRKD